MILFGAGGSLPAVPTASGVRSKEYDTVSLLP
jgi:hypothetical protein